MIFIGTGFMSHSEMACLWFCGLDSSGKYGIGLHSIDGRTNCIVWSCVFVVMLQETRNFTYL